MATEASTGARALPSASQTWRVGRSVGRTLYRNDELVGLVNTPEIAQQIVEALQPSPPASETETRVAKTPRDLAIEKFTDHLIDRYRHQRGNAEADALSRPDMIESVYEAFHYSTLPVPAPNPSLDEEQSEEQKIEDVETAPKDRCRSCRKPLNRADPDYSFVREWCGDCIRKYTLVEPAQPAEVAGAEDVERWIVEYENAEDEPQHAVLRWLNDEAKALPEAGTTLVRADALETAQAENEKWSASAVRQSQMLAAVAAERDRAENKAHNYKREIKAAQAEAREKDETIARLHTAVRLLAFDHYLYERLVDPSDAVNDLTDRALFATSIDESGEEVGTITGPGIQYVRAALSPEQGDEG